MPHFFLHIRDRDGLTADPEGTELPDLEAAQTDALAAARKILAEPIAKDGKTGDPRFEIIDEAGRLLLTVPFRDAIEPLPTAPSGPTVLPPGLLLEDDGVGMSVECRTG
jgi:hypothetical protein